MDKCLCLCPEYEYLYEEAGRENYLIITLDLTSKKLTAEAHGLDESGSHQQTRIETQISFCPFCGRRL